MAELTLKSMINKQAGVISRITGRGEVGLRLREMGLVKGANVTVMRRAPLQDPVHVRLNGHDLTLRNNEASMVLVEV
jgi:ferrous iron transport protein A